MSPKRAKTRSRTGRADSGRQPGCPLCDGLFEEIGSVLSVPKGFEEFVDHLGKAKLEILKGIRSLLEHRIEELERKPRRKRRVEKIDIAE